MVRLGSFVEQLGDLGGLRVHMSPMLRQHAVAVQRAAVLGRSLDVGPQR
jgi:hypothetical protein